MNAHPLVQALLGSALAGAPGAPQEAPENQAAPFGVQAIEDVPNPYAAYSATLSPTQGQGQGQQQMNPLFLALTQAAGPPR